MKPFLQRAVFSVVIILAALSGSYGASASTITNAGSWDGSSGISPFGAPDTTSFGQTFFAPDFSLLSWSFLVASDLGGNAKFVLAQWDGSKPIGPALYTSAEFAIAGGGSYQWAGVSGLHLSLHPGGDYIVYFTIADISKPVTGSRFATTTDGAGLSGDAAVSNSDGADPITVESEWIKKETNFVFKADFDDAGAVAVTPIPASLPLFATAIGGLGAVAFRRRKIRDAH